MLDSTMFTEYITEKQLKSMCSSVVSTAYYLNAQVVTLAELNLLNGDLKKLAKLCRRQSDLATLITQIQIEIGFDYKLFDFCITLDNINDEIRNLYFKYQEHNKIKVSTLKFDFSKIKEESENATVD